MEPPTYILERCIADAGDDGGASKSEEAGEWEKVYEGRHTSRQIPALQPGTSYKIRVRVKSAEGIVGPPGPSAVINTALQIPDPPRVQGCVSPSPLPSLVLVLLGWCALTLCMCVLVMPACLQGCAA